MQLIDLESGPVGIVGSLTPIKRDDIQVSDLQLHEEGTRLRNGGLMKGNRGVKVKKEEASMGFCELLDGDIGSWHRATSRTCLFAYDLSVSSILAPSQLYPSSNLFNVFVSHHHPLPASHLSHC